MSQAADGRGRWRDEGMVEMPVARVYIQQRLAGWRVKCGI